MSKVQLAGNASGTGIFQIASPNSNTDRTLTLPDATGTVQVSGNPISGTTGTFTGLLDISASGAGQIQFPASQNASSNANTLDDYEEGTWTPVWAAISGSMTYASGGQVGTYTKIGRQVTAYCHVITTANNSLSGALQLNNLPFASSSAANYCVGTMHMEGCNIQAAVWAWGYVAPGTQTAYFRYWANNAGAATVTGSQLNANSDIMFAVTYFV